jgi:hypothetical protein
MTENVDPVFRGPGVVPFPIFPGRIGLAEINGAVGKCHRYLFHTAFRIPIIYPLPRKVNGF